MCLIAELECIPHGHSVFYILNGIGIDIGCVVY